MHVRSDVVKTHLTQLNWYQALAKYERPNPYKATWQLLDTFVPYIVLWIFMVCMVRMGVSYWCTLPLVVVAAGLLVRIFIFFHDCCHGSFFASRRANRIVGYVCGILTFTPYEDWRRPHAIHHATAGDLNRRGTGDVWTWTVAEYLAAPKRKQWGYRLFRHPFFLFGVAPLGLFLIKHRFVQKEAGKRERYSVIFTNLAVLALIGLASLTIGLRTYLLIQLPIIALAGAIGVWLFYVQHQFEGVYWAQHQDWDPMRAALEGGSYYRLPKVLQWFSGNIGLHHIHHLRPRIPNYNLQRCYEDIPALQVVEPLTLLGSLKSLHLHLWDESNQKLVSFRSLKRHSQQTKPPN
jgi:omega-6 fatty acid desaturase (delta-12 desaturase)